MTTAMNPYVVKTKALSQNGTWVTKHEAVFENDTDALDFAHTLTEPWTLSIRFGSDPDWDSPVAWGNWEVASKAA